MNRPKSIFRITYRIIRYILAFLYDIICKLMESILERLRFSISFKITVIYGCIFFGVLVFMITSSLFALQYYVENIGKNQYIQFLTAVMLLTGVIGFIIIIFLGLKASKKFLLPVKEMTDTVNKISIEDLDTRIDVKGSKNELKDLAKTFNEMLERIQNSVEQQNRFVSDASHELRTPIAVIQGYANLLARWGKDDKKVLEESIESIRSEAENMKGLVEQLLFLARGDKNTQKVNKAKIKLDEIIDEIIRETKLIDKEHNLESKYNDKISIYGDRELIKEALRIFVDNSIKYTQKGGTITVDSYVKENSAVIVIADTGVGISKEDIPHIFERFYRVDKSRTKSSGGTGLGLSIAKWIIDKHYGKIDVWSELQIGTIMKITFPLFHV
ncbi:sensor histidine kinase [Clostridium sp. HV4-5-A1G]|uniref:sensor histidine kinase n=1 Tax=Clostridium sp. HV4-5-A1G TaxID=2004595 RepID=UPI001238FF16|nr:HAMP domain-containing sensor histidine kinase [Clostridium sp. HV4-5-A1G]KAA8669320.1 HAMP domain-containing histidine kinase [Clostridium sp. HV4-5-A1G]